MISDSDLDDQTCQNSCLRNRIYVTDDQAVFEESDTEFDEDFF